LDKDAAEENRVLDHRNPVKAYSEINQVNSLGNASGYGNHSEISRHSMPVSQSLNRARERQIELLSAQNQENLYRFKVEQHLVPLKKVPVLLPNGQTKYESPPGKRNKTLDR
jgi:hypothetical protein